MPPRRWHLVGGSSGNVCGRKPRPSTSAWDENIAAAQAKRVAFPCRNVPVPYCDCRAIAWPACPCGQAVAVKRMLTCKPSLLPPFIAVRPLPPLHVFLFVHGRTVFAVFVLYNLHFSNLHSEAWWPRVLAALGFGLCVCGIFHQGGATRRHGGQDAHASGAHAPSHSLKSDLMLNCALMVL